MVPKSKATVQLICLYVTAIGTTMCWIQRSIDALTLHPITPRLAHHQRVPPDAVSLQKNLMRRRFLLLSYNTPDDDSFTPIEPATVSTTPPTRQQASATPDADSSSSPYPIDLPSPLLLATSMVLAIVGTGSGFDLANGTPRYGFGITLSIAIVALILSVGLFYASILKATAETEADDKEYMRGK